MDFKDLLKQLGERVTRSKDLVQTEEATKNAFIMPFIQTLGYDVFNPLEVVPEYTADIGIKQGEKVDYAILKDSEPIILIECKHWSANLDPHNSQLFRYFHTSKAKFGLLTNGLEYRFYTDLIEANKMDEKPFFVFNITEIKDVQVEELKKFHKAYFDFNTIVNAASELKYLGEIKTVLHNEFNNPSPEFVKLITKQFYSGVITQKLLDQFTQLTKRSISQYLNDSITDRLKTALKSEEAAERAEIESQPIIITPDNKIETTEEELEAFQIIKSILRKVCPVSKIVHRDAQSYFAILFEDNNRKPICRMYLNTSKKYIALFDENKKEVKKEISTLDDIFNFADDLLKTVENYI